MLRKTYECFNITIEDKVAHIQMSRPDALNTMSTKFWNEIKAIVKEIDSEALARVMVISSTGKHFTAGLDLASFAGETIVSKQNDRYIVAEKFRSDLKIAQSAFNVIEDARTPVLFACQGGVVGGGIDMITAGDIRWCTKDAWFCIQEINIGMTADVGTFPRLQRFIPEGWVKEMAYTGRRLNAEKAKEIGLVNDYFDSQEEMIEYVLKTAREIASKNPLAITGSKVLINYGRDHNTADTLDYIAVWNAGMLPLPHIQEAMVAKSEKREPVFPDLAPLRDDSL